MDKPVWTLATGDYDRVRALWDGTLASEQFDLDVSLLSPDVIFAKMVKEGAFDFSEMSLSTYVVLLSHQEPPFVAIPAFPSRKFRHGDIYVRADSPYRSPGELKGLRIGVPEYQLTMLVWVRGVLSDEYGIPSDKINWFVGGLDAPGRKDKVPLKLPPSFSLQPIGKEDTLNAMLLDGRIDAVMSPKAPAGFSDGSIRRLFSDYAAEEEAYYRRTGIFPLIHTVVIRRDVYEAHPEAAAELYRLYLTAKNRCFERYRARMALTVSLPWFDAELDRIQAMMGQDFWSYGVGANRTELELFLRYMREQGLVPETYRPDAAELFAAETRNT